MKLWITTLLVAGIAAFGTGCTAKIAPADLARIEAASNSAEAAASKCQAASADATIAAASAANSAEAADRAARKAEAIFGTSLRK